MVIAKQPEVKIIYDTLNASARDLSITSSLENLGTFQIAVGYCQHVRQTGGSYLTLRTRPPARSGRRRGPSAAWSRSASRSHGRAAAPHWRAAGTGLSMSAELPSSSDRRRWSGPHPDTQIQYTQKKKQSKYSHVSASAAEQNSHMRCSLFGRRLREIPGEVGKTELGDLDDVEEAGLEPLRGHRNTCRRRGSVALVLPALSSTSRQGGMSQNQH